MREVAERAKKYEFVVVIVVIVVIVVPLASQSW